MAINYWKLAGKPLAYSPLPTGFTNSLNLGMGDFIAIIKARSASQSRLHITSASLIDKSSVATLSSTSKEYVLSFTSTRSQTFYLYDTDTKGDIIIEDVQIVQKPLPKLTLNGIDPFGAKWTLHPNAKIIDESTLELNATGTFQDSYLDVVCLPNTNYFFGTTTSNGTLYYKYLDINKNTISQSIVPANGVLTTPSNCVYIRYILTNYITATGKFTFTKPMLNLGTIPAPYSKKTGDKMVLPVAKKNLFDGRYVDTSGYSVLPNTSVEVSTTFVTSVRYPVIPNKDYTFSFLAENVTGSTQPRISIRKGSDGSALNSLNDGTGNKVLSFNSGSEKEIYVLVYGWGERKRYSNMQLEEGTTPTKYEPYAVQLNPKPKKFVPKKNMINKPVSAGTSVGTMQSDGWFKFSGATAVSYGAFLVEVVNGVTRYASCDVHNRNAFPITVSASYAGANVQVFTIAPNEVKRVWSFWSATVTSSASSFRVWETNGYDFYANNVQHEEGTQTPYEPYQLITPRAKTGLSFNGVTDYLQLPSMTMDAIEIDCLINSGQETTNNGYYIDARNGLDNGYMRYGDSGLQSWSYLKNNGVLISNPFAQIKRDVRQKLLFGSNTPFTDDVTIFNFGSPGGGAYDHMKGVIYKVTPYLNGVPLVTYDFETPSNIVGDKVIPNAKNLIPSFEDARWSLHVNTQVLGKDVLRLNASGAGQQSEITFNVKANDKYLFSAVSNSNPYVQFQDNSGGQIGSNAYLSNGSVIVTVPNGATKLVVRNGYNPGAGTFDFIQPKLFQLDGREATIVGKPTQLNKASKRTLYAKR